MGCSQCSSDSSHASTSSHLWRIAPSGATQATDPKRLPNEHLRHFAGRAGQIARPAASGMQLERPSDAVGAVGSEEPLDDWQALVPHGSHGVV